MRSPAALQANMGSELFATTSVLQRPHCDQCSAKQSDVPSGSHDGIQLVDIPAFGSEEIIDQVDPEADGAATTDGCAQPRSATKVVSGPFQGGYTMDDYFPDLVGGGFYQHPGTAGPFDTGSRVGANAQLFGTIASPCQPSGFSLAQTVQYTRALFDGRRHPKEGVVQDDIAKSGRDASRPPFRREWLGNPLGLNISMADPPSVGYTASSNIEFDRSFVTSLVGSGGRRSVSWSTSIRIVSGSVTRNTIS